MTPEQAEAKPVLYPRDPSLDPQLVWKGKDEQDSQALEVPSVPIYIQEKIHPQALIEELRAFAAKERNEEQAQLFSDFNGLTLEQQVEFYRHSNHWSNRMILGDSLLTMTSLAEREGLKGKVQMIYLDPPYGIKFGSNWQVSTRKRDVKDTGFDNVTRQPEQIKAFRDTWELGIHSYLAYLRDRLVVARELLTESGSLFVQIGDENVHLVRCLMDEVMGSENFVSIIAVKKTGLKGSAYLDGIIDYLLWYGKDSNYTKYRPILIEKEAGVGKGTGERYDQIETPEYERRPLATRERKSPDTLKTLLSDGSRLFQYTALISESSSATTTFDIHYQGRKFYRTNWKTTEHGFKRLIQADRIIIGGETLRYMRYLDDFMANPIANFWDDTGLSDKIYVVQTTTKVIERCLLMTTDPGDLVLDPTCGSGTTAYVAEQWGRRWITIDTSRVALALARTRLMAGKYPFYLLADSDEGKRKEESLGGTPPPSPPASGGEETFPTARGGEETFPTACGGDKGGVHSTGDVRKGFVWKRVPHVTLKSIANNDEIDAIHAKWQKQLEPLRAEINRLAGKNWEEWEIPRTPLPAPPASEVGKTVAPASEGGKIASTASISSISSTKIEEYWSLRRSRQQEIDASIARHADTETLYDQPYEDKKRVRVAGPFTVESLSPTGFSGYKVSRSSRRSWVSNLNLVGRASSRRSSSTIFAKPGLRILSRVSG